MESLLDVGRLSVTFDTELGRWRVLNDICFELGPGVSMAVVGESGSGKSILGHAIMRLLDNVASIQGEVRFRGCDIYGMEEREVERLRGSAIVLVPQNPASALNPVLRVGDHLAEVARKHGAMTRRDARDKGFEALRKVGFHDPAPIFDTYPHRLSGGMCERVLIAMALTGGPDLVIADEPTKGLDPLAKRVIMDVLVRNRGGNGLLLITHDLKVAAQCARIAVLYGGRIVEMGETEEILRSPAHPYMRLLLEAHPERGLKPIPGRFWWSEIPAEGCSFRNRCDRAARICETDPPMHRGHRGSLVRCHFA
jgi:peptide/nickel transport system ATP-binding protein